MISEQKLKELEQKSNRMLIRGDENWADFYEFVLKPAREELKKLEEQNKELN